MKESNEQNQYCGFKIDGEHFAIPVMSIQEVIKPLPVTVVPLSRKFIRGLINLRGQIVTCLSLRNLFGREDDLERPYMNIIIRTKSGLYSLIVDEVTDIIEAKPESLEKTPETLKAGFKDYVKQVFKEDDGLIILLDVEKIIKSDKTKTIEGTAA